MTAATMTEHAPFRADQVGSLLRPPELKAARERRAKGELSAAALAEIADSVPADGVALVVSHGAAIRTACGALLGWSPEAVLTLRGMDNCGWAVLRRHTAEDPWRLVAYNRTAPVS